VGSWQFLKKGDHGSSRSVLFSFLLRKSVLLVNVKKINRKFEHIKSTHPLGSQEIKDDVKQTNI
jgi:hypothetical protein